MISAAELIKELGYDDSPNFVTGADLGRVPGYGHIFRRAQNRPEEGAQERRKGKSCGLKGVYTLRQDPRQDASPGAGSFTPVVYVCEAEGEVEADKIHRLVWNQDVVPFVIVRTPQSVRVYSGFGYVTRTQTHRESSRRRLSRKRSPSSSFPASTPSGSTTARCGARRENSSRPTCGSIGGFWSA